MLLMTAGQSLFAWGNWGHSTVAIIADRHLTPRARANIAKYIDNKSILYYASWMDYNRKFEPYKVTNDWHVDYWEESMRTDSEGNPQRPQVARQLERVIGELADFRSLNDSLVNINIKFLVHLMGDMHCPVHVNFPQGRRLKIAVEPLDCTMTYHKMWDGAVFEVKYPELSPAAYADLLDNLSRRQIAKIQKGNIEDWYNQTAAMSDEVRAMLREDLTADAKYFDDVAEAADAQILNAGLRLAAVLNAIFDK